MINPPSFPKIFTEPGPLIVLGVTIALLVGIVGPAYAQFFNFGGPPARSRGGGGGGWFGSDFFSPFQPQAPKRVYQDFSKAPAPEKREGTPERNVMVMGDGMADWLAYGLEDAYAEQADMGVIRKARNTSGLIKYQPKDGPSDWTAGAKVILATEKADIIVVMLGLNDRVAIREPATGRTDKAVDKRSDKNTRAKGDGRSDTKSDGMAGAKPEAAEKPGVDTELPQDDADNAVAPPVKSARSPNGLYQFRENAWIELYSKKLEEMIAAVKSKG